MAELYAQNLAALERRYPGLAARLKETEEDRSYELVASPSGLWNLVVHGPEGPVPFSRAADPLQEAREGWARTRLRNPVLLVFLGLDLGYQLSTLLARPNPNTLGYLLVERDLEVFRKFLHVVDVGTLVRDPRFHLLVGVPEDGLFGKLRDLLEYDLMYTRVRATRFIDASASYRRAEGYYRSFLVAFRDAVQDILSFIGNSPLDSFVGIRQMLLNLEVIAREPGVSQLFGRFSGKPAVVVATGPSLDKNFRLLREIQDRALIFSVDASLKFLLRHGIRPHFVTCIERVPATVPFFEGLEPEHVSETVQIAVPVVVPEVYAKYPGPKAMMFRPTAHFDWLQNDKGTLLVGHSSANMAFKLATRFGCDRILLVGQDLAYAENGDTHSEAAYWGKALGSLRPELVQAFPVRGNYQERILTNPTWNLFRLAYERDVAEFAGKVVNATEGGAYIEGTEVMPLRDAIERYVGEAFAPARQIAGFLERPSAEQADAFVARIRGERIPQTLACLERVVRSYRKTVSRARKMLKSGGRSGGLVATLQEAYHLWTRQTEDPLYHQSAVLLVQAAFVQGLIDFFDVPNHHDDVEEIHRRRLELVAGSMETMVQMLGKLKQLYLDPASTVPADYRRILG